MTTRDQAGETDSANDRISKHLDLAAEFFAAVFDNPSIIEETSEGSYLFFVPGTGAIRSLPRWL